MSPKARSRRRRPAKESVPATPAPINHEEYSRALFETAAIQAVRDDRVEDLVTEIAVSMLRYGTGTYRSGRTIHLCRWICDRMKENREYEQKELATLVKIGSSLVAPTPGV